MEKTNAMLTWDENRFSIGSHTFQTLRELSDLFIMEEADGFVLGKTRRYIDKYVEHLANRRLNNIFELGIFRGGSTVFLNEFFRPRRLAAIDYMGQPAKQLERYIQEYNQKDRLKTFYGVNQADTEKLMEIYSEVFQEERLDLVVDDASHFLNESRISFNALFPRLRQGGVYLIEDWAWSHLPVKEENVSRIFGGKEPLSCLIIEIILASVSQPKLIDEVIVNDGFAIVRRGSADAPPDFDVSQLGFLMGEPISGRNWFGRKLPNDAANGDADFADLMERNSHSTSA